MFATLLAIALLAPVPAAPKPAKCSIIYVNGDAVISCPTLIVRGGK